VSARIGKRDIEAVILSRVSRDRKTARRELFNERQFA
jgi:hypothetical protein